LIGIDIQPDRGKDSGSGWAGFRRRVERVGVGVGVGVVDVSVVVGDAVRRVRQLRCVVLRIRIRHERRLHGGRCLRLRR
jgi:hypothetical protein